jgi:hypothetical protein
LTRSCRTSLVGLAQRLLQPGELIPGKRVLAALETGKTGGRNAGRNGEHVERKSKAESAKPEIC